MPITIAKGNILTLRWKTYLLVGTTLLAAILVVYVVSQTVFMRGFANVETRQMQDQVKRAQAAIAQNLAELDADVFSYSSWDDTVAFMETSDQAYVDSNLPDSFYTGFKANVAVFVKTDGTVVYGQGYDLQKGQPTSLPAGLSNYLTPDSPLVRLSSVGSKVDGILMLPEGPMLVSSQPILAGNGTGPVRGAVLIGRWLDASRIAELSAQTLLSLHFVPVDAAGLPADVRQATVATSPPGNAIVARPDAHTVAGYAVLNDVFGQPALVLRVDTPRDVYAEGSTSIRYFIYALVGILLVFGLATSRVLETLVLSRVARLTATVRGARSGEGKRTPITLKGKDELSELAQTIDSGFFELESMREELEQRHQELARSEEHFRALIMNSSDLIAVMDANGTMQFQSPSSERILGYRPEELEGKSAFDFVHPGDLATSQRAFAELMREEWDPSQMLETRFRHKDGSWRTLEMMGKRLDGPSGELLCILNSRDVTERKHLEEEHLRLERQLQQSQRLESLGILAGGIAHDFNNILTGVLGNADLALNELSPSTLARENLLEIMAASHRAADLCRQMLAYSGRGHFVVGPLDLGALVTDMVDLLRSTISKKARLDLRLGKDLPFMHGDASQISQVVMNLVMNASEALGDEDGVITISTRLLECSREHLRRTYAAKDLTPGAYLVLEVSDTGSGMDRETQERIFEPFYTTKFTGRGLGLAAVQGIVRGHKGALMVSSEPGEGTTFTIMLPAPPAEAGAQLPKIAEKVDDWQGRGTVLLVDDEETIRTLGARMLKRLGFEFLLAADGRQALQIYSQHLGEISLVLLDLTMPHMDGEETFRELRLLDPQVPVVLSSGYSEQEVTSRLAGQNVAGFVQKPYTLELLRERLREALSGETDRFPQRSS